MKFTAPRLVWDLEFGHILQAGTVIVSALGIAWWQSAWQADIKRDTDRLITYIPRVEMLERLPPRVEALERYTVKIEALEKSNTIQDERLGSISDSVREIRKGNSDALRDIATANSIVSAKLSTMGEDIATIKAQMPSIKRR